MFRDFDQSTQHDTSSVLSAAHNKDYYKKNKLSAIYKEHDPITGDLIEEGQFQYGIEVGLWKVIDQDEDEQHFRYREERIGARCGDGSFSSATGRGACSWHGGVASWISQNKRYQVGGTGKYEPIEVRVQRAKEKLRDQLKMNVLAKSDQQLLVQVTNKLLKQNPNAQQRQEEIQQLIAQKVSEVKSQYSQKINQLQQIQSIIESQNDKLKVQKRQLQQKLASSIKPSQKQKGYQEIIRRMKKNYQDQLRQQDREIVGLRKQLQQVRLKTEKKKEKVNLSLSRSSNDNQQVKNQIKMIQEQLNLLNRTVEISEQRRKGCEESESDQDWEDQQDSQQYARKESKQDTKHQKVSVQEQKKKQTKLENKPKIQTKPTLQAKPKLQTKPNPKLQTKPKQTPKPQTKPKQTPKHSHPQQQKQKLYPCKKIQSLNQSQQSSIPLYKHQPSINDSLSYSKILNSKLFRDQNNKSDLSIFVDFKSTKKNDSFSDKQNKKSEKSVESINDQKRKYQFRQDEQSSEEDHGVTLKTDSDDGSEDNVDIFRSIPFKSGQSKFKPREDSLFKEKK